MHLPVHPSKTPLDEPSSHAGVNPFCNPPVQIAVLEAGAPPPARPDGAVAAVHRHAPLQAAIAQQWEELSLDLADHTPLLAAIATTSDQARSHRSQVAIAMGQSAQVALAAATQIEGDIARLNNSIQQRLQQFDAQLAIAAQTTHQEVNQKVTQLRRHIQQQSNSCRAALNLDADDQPRWTSAHRHQVARLFQATTLQPRP